MFFFLSLSLLLLVLQRGLFLLYLKSQKFVQAGIDLTSIEHNEGMFPHAGNYKVVPPILRTHFEPKQFIDWSPYVMVENLEQYDCILIDGEARGECLAWTARYADRNARIY